MAHRSRKKHVKHMHAHDEAAGPTRRATSAVHKAPARPTQRARDAMRSTLVGAARSAVRSLALRVTERVTAAPRRILARAKDEVRGLLERRHPVRQAK